MQVEAKLMEISGIESSREKTTYRFYDWSCEEVFDSEAEALVAADKIRLEQEDYAHKQMVWAKERNNRTWSWSCSYYRRQIANAKRDLAYAEARLNVAMQKRKEPAASPDRGAGEKI